MCLHTQQVAQLDVLSKCISAEAVGIALHADHAQVLASHPRRHPLPTTTVCLRLKLAKGDSKYAQHLDVVVR